MKMYPLFSPLVWAASLVLPFSPLAAQSLEVCPAIELKLKTEPGRLYVLQYSSDLQTWETEEEFEGAAEDRYVLRSARDQRGHWRLVDLGLAPVPGGIVLEDLQVDDDGPVTFVLPSELLFDGEGEPLRHSFSASSTGQNSPAHAYHFTFDGENGEVTAWPGAAFQGTGVYPVSITTYDAEGGQMTKSFDIVNIDPVFFEQWKGACEVFSVWSEQLGEFEGVVGMSLRLNEADEPVLIMQTEDEGIPVPSELEVNGIIVPVFPELASAKHLSLSPGDNVNQDSSSTSVGTLAGLFERKSDGKRVGLTNLHVAAQDRIYRKWQLDQFASDVNTGTGVRIYAANSGSKRHIGKIDRFNQNWWETLLRARNNEDAKHPIYDAASIELKQGEAIWPHLPKSHLLPRGLRCPKGPVFQWDLTGAKIAAMVKQQRKLLKVGRTTGTTVGRLKGIGTQPVFITTQDRSIFRMDYGKYLEVEDPQGNDIVDEGDSGALVMFQDNLQMCGLLFGGNVQQHRGGSTFFMQPLQPILDDLGLRPSSYCPPIVDPNLHLQYFVDLGGEIGLRQWFDSVLAPGAERQVELAPGWGTYVASTSEDVEWLHVAVTDSFGNRAEFDNGTTFDEGLLILPPGEHELGKREPETMDWAIRIDREFLQEHGLLVEPEHDRWFVEVSVGQGEEEEVFFSTLQMEHE